MHCPKCGQQQVSEETRFCSRCGLLLTEIEKIVALDGRTPVSGKHNSSARVRGLKRGLFILLTAFLFVPLTAIIALAFEADTPVFPVIIACLTIVGGMLRMAYALLFESGEPDSAEQLTAEKGRSKGIFRKKKSVQELPAMPAATAATPFYSAPEQGKWRDTNDLNARPSSVTDNTTKLLHQEDDS